MRPHIVVDCVMRAKLVIPDGDINTCMRRPHKIKHKNEAGIDHFRYIAFATFRKFYCVYMSSRVFYVFGEVVASCGENDSRVGNSEEKEKN